MTQKNSLDIITIYNYEPFDKHLVFLRMWLHQVSLYNDAKLKVKVLSLHNEPRMVGRWHQFYPFEWVKLGQRKDLRISRLRRLQMRFNKEFAEYSKLRKRNKVLNHHNVAFKMWNLTQWKTPFIFLDVDAIVFENLSHLVNNALDKPFIGINHQNIPGHTEGTEPFINGGVQIVSNPKYFTFEQYTQVTENLYCRGAEQALMFTTFINANYDYTHPQIGHIWNSCSGYNRVSKINNRWVCFSEGVLKNDIMKVSLSIPRGKEIAINHYWDKFKPWRLNCDMYEEFRLKISIEETALDRFYKNFYKNTY